MSIKFHKSHMYKNYKEMMTVYIYLSIIFILVLSMLINFLRNFDERFVINISTLIAFVLGLYWYVKSDNPSRAEISMTFMVIISDVLLATLVLKEHYLNYTTVFPMLITFALWYFYTLKRALWMSLFHFSFWIIIYVYGYYHYPEHTLLHNTTAMIGLVISYIFMGLFGFSYYLSTSKYQTKLEQANLQQNLLLKEIHHRVKNNLNIVSSMLGIQQMCENEMYVIELMKKNRLRIESIAMIHEILYKHDDFSNINLSDYIEQLLIAIKDMYSANIEIVISKDEVFLPLDIVLKLGIITNELAINSLKHAFQGNSGMIKIYFTIGNDTLVYVYKDSGICTKKKKEEIWKHANLGLKLIKMMLQEINAEVKLIESKGLSYQIEVPL